MSARARGGNGCLLDGVVGPRLWWSWHQRLGMAPELGEGGQDSIAAEASIVEGLGTEVGQQLTEVVPVRAQPGARQGELRQASGVGRDEPEDGFAMQPALDESAAAVDGDGAGFGADIRGEA